MVNKHAGVPPNMVIWLAQAFGGSAETWLHLQMQHDLWQAEQRAGRINVKRFAVPVPTTE